MADELPPLQLVVRDGEGAKLVTAPPSADDVLPDPASAVTLVEGKTESATYSPKGTFIAVVTSSSVQVFNTTTFAPVSTIAQARIIALSFSPSERFLVTFHRRRGDERNLEVWETATGTKVASHPEKTFTPGSWPMFHFSDDEAIACRAAVTTFQLFSTDTIGGPAIGTGHVANIDKVSLAPGPPPYKIAAFVKETSSKPAGILLFVHPHLDRPVAMKNFHNASSASFHWAPNGSALLFHAQSDASKDNYYGDSHIYFLTPDGKHSLALRAPKAGPVHDVAWAPDSRHFVLIAGRSPPSVTLYNAKAEPAFDFGVSHRNAAAFSPHGRFIMLSGFGSMAGEMDLWDRNKRKVMGSNRDECVTHTEWSPDGRWVINASTRPRMQTDNGYRMYKYHGAGPVATQDFGELRQVAWRPAAKGVFPDRPQSPTRAGAGGGDDAPGSAPPPPAKPKRAGVYRPPHATGSISAMMNADKSGSKGKLSGPGARYSAPVGLPPGAAPPGAKPATKNQKAKGRRKAKEEEAAKAAASKAAVAAAAAGVPLPVAAAPPTAGGVTPDVAAKKVKALGKKLKQIDVLLAKQAGGQTLDADQTAKVGTKAEVEAQLAQFQSMC